MKDKDLKTDKCAVLTKFDNGRICQVMLTIDQQMDVLNYISEMCFGGNKLIVFENDLSDGIDFLTDLQNNEQ